MEEGKFVKVYTNCWPKCNHARDKQMCCETYCEVR
ncbi:MAG: hypothetical protein ACI90V_009239, partial [Bacillariaceae sp.]